ncbi:hypothetical protein PLICBS_003377 [Purpureocillium lilacinum]|uniref:uncharacterized protein n=1 Tax=Purpureocillium lilacinum TaxID=33203 RepID=UPI002081245C|nr:hypothetical protein PLICBS_003377 [Purpureocillium lilacinum]
MGTAKCATEVLRGLIYNLLRTDEKALVRPTADPNTHDDVHEFSRLSRVLRKRLQKATAEGYRVILVVEGIDQCADDASEVGVPHLLSTLRDAWKEGNENDVDTNIQCIISSRPSRDIELELRLLDFNFEVIDLESGFVAQELGLEDLIVAIQRDANQLQAPYNSLKESSRVTESSSWFEYSNAGRDWLRRANYEASPVRTLWYRRSGGNFQPQKLLIACVESLMSKYDNTNPRTLYFSFASECLQTLEVNHISLRREQVPDALVQTNRWLWSHASFQRWEEEGGLLWIYGRPGSGKSVLAKTILRELENSSNSTTHLERRLICDWFYNSSGGDVGTAHSFMLRSVLRNILRRSEHLFDKVKHHYRSLFDAKGTNDVAWTTAALCDLLLEISASPAAPDTLIVVDGLDESENGDNLEAKQYFVGFLYKFSQLTLSRVRWIVLSRPEPVIRDAFRGANRRISCAINMDEENEDDINTIIGAGLDGIRAAWERSVGLVDDKETSSSVDAVLLGMATYLKEQANGVILWVSLALNQLKLSVESKYGFSLHDLDKIMRGLPLGLDDFYSKIMLNLNVVSDPERLSTTKAMLTWIIGARRWAPLQLRHLREVMAMAKLAQVDKRPDMDMLESHRPVVRSPRDWSGFRGIIYQHCGPLVEIRLSNADDKPKVAPSSTLEMLHETARSYLKDERRSGVFYIDTVAAEQTVLVESFKYLGFAIPPPTLLDADSEHHFDRLLGESRVA